MRISLTKLLTRSVKMDARLVGRSLVSIHTACEPKWCRYAHKAESDLQHVPLKGKVDEAIPKTPDSVGASFNESIALIRLAFFVLWHVG